MTTPQIVGYDPGYHNREQEKTIQRLVDSGHYKDQSTVIIIPALNTVATKAASSWLNMYSPPNQRVVRLFAQGMEVGEAYSQTIETILNHPELSKYKYILTLEADNVVPPDGFVKLLEQMDKHPELSCVGGLYYTKFHGGQPQIWGDPNDPVLNFRPQVPRPGELQECCGTGMGFNLWRMEMFKDPRLPRPLFKTTCSTEEGCYTQDLRFWSNARKYGYRCGIDCGILVGHVDSENFVW